MASTDDLAGAACPPSSSSPPPSGVPLLNEDRSIPAIDAGHRDELRGLGGHLIGPDHNILWGGAKNPHSWLGVASRIVAVADPDLHDTLHPYDDPALLESHGEQLLDFVIRLACEKQWDHLMCRSMRTSALTGETDIFLRLFASYRSPMSDDMLLGLFCAAGESGSVETMSALIDSGAETLMRAAHVQHSRYAVLHWAARAGHQSFVARLIDAGVPFDSRFSQMGTALTEAVKGGHKCVVQDLLAAGADVNKIMIFRPPDLTLNSRVYSDFTALGVAVHKNDEEMVKVLLEAGADPSKGSKYNLPLCMAASQGSCVILKGLLSAGASVHPVDIQGHSALYLACAYNQHDAVRLLLRHKASVASLCKLGRSPMDVVGAQVLALRQWSRAPEQTTGLTHPIAAHVPRLRRQERDVHDYWLGEGPWIARPGTLNSAETSAAENIRDALRSVNTWSRRGWLIMMRSRSLAEVVVEQPDHSDADALTLSVRDVHLEYEPSSNPAGFSEESGIPRVMHAGARTGWGAAVVWLLRRPDDVLFCNIIRFI